jgi:pimeloyl-ACP methyl ester carboxylesterase
LGYTHGMSDGEGKDWPRGISALAARRDRAGAWKVFARYSLAPVHSSLPVVLVHGMNISSAFFRPALRRIGNHHRVYAPDLPGYGLSDKPRRTLRIEEQSDVLARWFEAVGLSSALVVGVSMGSQFASALADRRPDLVRGLVLASPTMDPELRSRPRAMLRWAMELPAELRMIPVMLRDYMRAGVKRADDTFTLALEDRIEDRLPRLHMPAMVLHGENDHIVSSEWARRVAELLPEGHVVTLPGASHAMNFSSADDFSRAVVEFATDLTARPADVDQEVAA